MVEEKTEKRKYRLTVYDREGDRFLGSYDYVFDLPPDQYNSSFFIKNFMDIREAALQALIKTEITELTEIEV